MSKNKFADLLTAKDLNDPLESPFRNEVERLKYMKTHYNNMGIAKSFAIFYGLDISQEVKSDRAINTINTIELGKIYSGTVKEFTKSSLVFDVPGVKEEIISRENFASCMENIENYLLTHDNKLLFEVREKKGNTYIVSVIQAYYRQWVNAVNKAVEHEDGLQVHIDDLVKGGYVCHTLIRPLYDLTGKNYTSSVFIPGSHIVLNIESNFEKWIGQDVTIVPQKFVEFRKDMKTGMVENSLVGSRKRVLQIMGMKNMYDIYNEYVVRKKLIEGMATNKSNSDAVPTDAFDGTVTGIINSSKKTGVFVELNDKYITGLMPCDSSDLLDFKPGDYIRVRIKEFEVQEGKEPFIVNKKGQILKCNVRPVFELA